MGNRTVGLLGSGEFLPWASDVDRWLLDRSSGGDGSVAVVPTAAAPEGNAMFDQWASMGLDHYRTMGLDAHVVALKTRDDASDPAVIAGIDAASLIFFSGGNPAYLAATLRDTPLWIRLMERVDAGVAVGGCSAGACIFGEIAPDATLIESIEEAFKPPGLAVFPGLVFGAHWDVLDTYYPDLRGISIRALPAGARMIGIDETTAMMTTGDEWQVFGSSGVHVYEGEGATTYTAGQTFRIP